MKKPFIHRLMENPMSGPDIEARSFEIIDSLAPRPFPPTEWEVIRRMIHTTGDVGIAEDVRFSPDVFDAARVALAKGAPIYADSNMIRAGLSVARLREVSPEYSKEKILCHVADSEIAAEAKTQKLPRSLFAIRKARPWLTGSIVVFGNAPVALLELNRMIVEENVRPALVIAMPVGFVHVVESKEEFMSLGIPYVALIGRRGGSALAVSALHALCSLAKMPKKINQ